MAEEAVMIGGEVRPASWDLTGRNQNPERVSRYRDIYVYVYIYMYIHIPPRGLGFRVYFFG